MASTKNRKGRKRMGRKKMIPKALLPHFFVRRTSGAVEAVENLDLGGANATAPAVYKAYSTSINQLENYTELSNLFDSYQITAIKYEFIWNVAASGGVNLSAAYAPSLNYFYDYDDALTPSDTDFRQRRCKSIRLGVNRKHIIVNRRPTAASELYTGGLSGYNQMVSPKIDMASPAVEHYGLKVQIVKPTIDLGLIQVKKTVYVTCREQR